MKNTTRSAVRIWTAVGLLVSLIGFQSALSPATASTATTTWMPSDSPALWSDHNCATDNSAPTSTPTSPPSDALALSGTQGYAADTGSHATGASDVAWGYAPTNGQVGPAVTIPTTTTAMSIDAYGATSGRLMVTYSSTSNNQTTYYVGVQDFTTSAGWQTVNAGNLTWYQWLPGFLGSPGQWSAYSFLGSSNSLTLGTFFSRASNGAGTAQAAFELGCTGAFAFDHLRVTDSTTNVVDYDAQTPTSTTTVTQGATRINYGTTTTITPSTSSTDNTATTVNPSGVETLLGSTDGGATWSTVTTAAPGSAFTVSPTRSTSYKVRYTSSTPLNPQPSTSDMVSVAVVPKAVLSASAARVNVNRAETFTLRLTPAAADAPVTFQQASGTSWVKLGSTVTNPSGVATVIRSHASTGSWKVRAVIGAHPGYLSTVSNTVAVGVYQPVSISIARSAGTVPVGHSFRIYGVVTPHSSGIGLQLQQYLGGRWVLIATGRSATGGAYSFLKVARNLGTATFRVVAPASGYRLSAHSSVTRVTIYRPYTPPPPPPPTGGGGGGGSGIG